MDLCKDCQPPPSAEAVSIPGFVYNEVKQRYFKILANHVGPGASDYSTDVVKRHAQERLVSSV